jgi:spore maturation protein CgeB
MREEWDRRVAHDYRYWMSDGVQSDELMWETGERDLAIILDGFSAEALKQQTCLELGCGVGRLLRAASKRFRHVVGVDVSQEAIATAERLLNSIENVQLELGSGSDLAAIADQSIDFAFTFAALTSMPIPVIARYLDELSRVVRHDGFMRLQVYVGHQQNTFQEDTIAIRSFDRQRINDAFKAAGFDLQSSEELKLPFEVSDHEEGKICEIVTLRRNANRSRGAQSIESLLVEGEESTAQQSWGGSETEYLMAVARAQQCIEDENLSEAVVALEYAVSNFSFAEANVLEMLEELKRIEQGLRLSRSSEPVEKTRLDDPAGKVSISASSSGIYEQNIATLRTKFPEVARQIDSVSLSGDFSNSVNSKGESVIFFKGIALSHFEKPVRSGSAWCERVISSSEKSELDSALVFGFADAYHLEALIEKWQKEIHVFEPSAEVLHLALSTRDCRKVIDRLDSLVLESASLNGRVVEGMQESSCTLLVHPQTQMHSGSELELLKSLSRAERRVEDLRPNIAVVGPMYGGSLPIAGYVVEALKEMGQRVFPIDVSPFYSGFNAVGSFLKGHRKGAAENQYIDLISQVVLDAVAERPVDIVICLAQAPLTPRALTELRSRGIVTAMWFVEDCGRFKTWESISAFYDYMFLIQKGEALRAVESAGAGRAIYLPVACQPSQHGPRELSAEERAFFGSPISFVGAGYNNRRHVFSKFANRDFKIWGTEWPGMPPFTSLVQAKGKRVSVDEYVRVFNASTVNINLHSSAERDSVEPNGDFVNPRTFELAATGAFQLVDRRTLLPELFAIDDEIATFGDEKELFEKVDYFLQADEERQGFIERSRRRALAEHTYVHRVTSLLEYIYADRYEQIKARKDQSPWRRTLKAAEPYSELSDRYTTLYERGEEPRLQNLIEDIQLGEGSLSDTEQKLLFLHHVKTQISNVNNARKEKE